MLTQRKHNPKNQDGSAQTIFETLDSDTHKCFDTPYQKSAKIKLENGVVAVVCYIKPEYSSKGWREGTLSIAVVKNAVGLVVDALDDIENEYGKKEIILIGTKDSEKTLNAVKNFISENSNPENCKYYKKFEPYQQQLQDTVTSLVTLPLEQTVYVNFEKNNLILARQSDEQKNQSSIKRWCHFLFKPRHLTPENNKALTTHKSLRQES